MLPTLVVGGGIGGLATALAIARGGRKVHVVERADQFTEIGAGLQFGPNASRALDALGVLEDLLPLAVQPDRAVMRNALTGKTLTTLELGDTFRRRYGYPYLVVHRNDLLRLLLEHCESNEHVTLQTASTVVNADVRPGGASVQFADGSEYRTQALIAADGLHSVLRSQISAEPPVNSGYAAYRGTSLQIVEGQTAGREEVSLWIGPGIHLMQYNVRGGELANQVAVFRSPRYIAGYVEQGEWGGPEELDAVFASAATPVRQAVAGIDHSRFWPMFDRLPLTTWIKGSLLLTGDAAHPMLQYLGQGACQALEDAVELGYRLQLHGDDVAAAYRDFEHARIGRTTRCQVIARPWGELWHTDEPLTVGLRDHYFKNRAADDYSDIDWLYRPADPGSAAPGLTFLRQVRPSGVPAA